MSETEDTTCNEVYSVVVEFYLQDDLSCCKYRFATKCTLCCSGLWQNGTIRPVLKHGPRSLTCVQVLGCQTQMRNESKGHICVWGRNPFGGTIDRSWTYVVKDLSMSIYVGTRKMVNYAWIGRSQGKLWWRLVAILTCKSIVKFGYRGERLIESSSSWFPPKFPSG